METAEKIIRQVIELRLGKSKLTFGTKSPVGPDRRGLAGAAPNVDEQGADAESEQTWPQQPWEQSVVRYPLAGGTSAGFQEARAVRVEAGAGVREQGRRSVVHEGRVLRLCRQVAHAKA